MVLARAYSARLANFGRGDTQSLLLSSQRDTLQGYLQQSYNTDFRTLPLSQHIFSANYPHVSLPLFGQGGNYDHLTHHVTTTMNLTRFLPPWELTPLRAQVTIQADVPCRSVPPPSTLSGAGLLPRSSPSVPLHQASRVHTLCAMLPDQYRVISPVSKASPLLPSPPS